MSAVILPRVLRFKATFNSIYKCEKASWDKKYHLISVSVTLQYLPIVFRHLNSLPYLTKISTSTTYYPVLYGCNDTVSSRYDMYRDTCLTIRCISRYYFHACRRLKVLILLENWFKTISEVHYCVKMPV